MNGDIHGMGAGGNSNGLTLFAGKSTALTFCGGNMPAIEGLIGHQEVAIGTVWERCTPFLSDTQSVLWVTCVEMCTETVAGAERSRAIGYWTGDRARRFRGEVHLI